MYFCLIAAIQTGMVKIVQNLFVIVLQNILVETMALVIHKTTTPALGAPVIISTVVIAVKSAILIVPICHVMGVALVQIIPFYHWVTSVNVT